MSNGICLDSLRELPDLKDLRGKFRQCAMHAGLSLPIYFDIDSSLKHSFVMAIKLQISICMLSLIGLTVGRCTDLCT